MLLHLHVIRKLCESCRTKNDALVLLRAYELKLDIINLWHRNDVAGRLQHQEWKNIVHVEHVAGYVSWMLRSATNPKLNVRNATSDKFSFEWKTEKLCGSSKRKRKKRRLVLVPLSHGGGGRVPLAERYKTGEAKKNTAKKNIIN